MALRKSQVCNGQLSVLASKSKRRRRRQLRRVTELEPGLGRRADDERCSEIRQMLCRIDKEIEEGVRVKGDKTGRNFHSRIMVMNARMGRWDQPGSG
jgi:hypothetical protein